MVPSLLIALGLTLAAPAYAQRAAPAPKPQPPKPVVSTTAATPSDERSAGSDAGLAASVAHERAAGHGVASSVNNPFLRNATPAKSAAMPTPAATPAPAQSEAPPEINPVKLNGKRLGVVNGKSVYRDGEAYFFDNTDKPLSKREREVALAAPADAEAPSVAPTPPAPQAAVATKPGAQAAARPAAPARSASRK